MGSGTVNNLTVIQDSFKAIQDGLAAISTFIMAQNGQQPATTVQTTPVGSQAQGGGVPGSGVPVTNVSQPPGSYSTAGMHHANALTTVTNAHSLQGNSVVPVSGGHSFGHGFTNVPNAINNVPLQHRILQQNVTPTVHGMHLAQPSGVVNNHFTGPINSVASHGVGCSLTSSLTSLSGFSGMSGFQSGHVPCHVGNSSM